MKQLNVNLDQPYAAAALGTDSKLIKLHAMNQGCSHLEESNLVLRAQWWKGLTQFQGVQCGLCFILYCVAI